MRRFASLIFSLIIMTGALTALDQPVKAANLTLTPQESSGIINSYNHLMDFIDNSNEPRLSSHPYKWVFWAYSLTPPSSLAQGHLPIHILFTNNNNLNAGTSVVCFTYGAAISGSSSERQLVSVDRNITVSRSTEHDNIHFVLGPAGNQRFVQTRHLIANLSTGNVSPHVS